ncbi:hypothetical protein ALC62_04973 [Cyphomyrmex costatus]|uniref:Uncharacterized protein n=1 Tax=Cyphomyrmex costatus TaxID=456900 RepID=A0A195CU44_9HYME|nr:hypothetical protein ALC62_04973 [Cyphomyrmex costatus]
MSRCSIYLLNYICMCMPGNYGGYCARISRAAPRSDRFADSNRRNELRSYGWCRQGDVLVRTSAVVEKDSWRKRANNASNYRGGPSIQIVHIKDTTDESFDSKLALRQCRYVLVQGILASQQPRFKSFGLLRMERS